MSNTTVYMSNQYFHHKMAINTLSIIIGVNTGLMALFLVFWSLDQKEERDARQKCDEIAKNSSYITKFTGTTCWIQLHDGTDGFTSETWIPSEWMTIG